MRVFDRHPVGRLAAKLLLISAPLLAYAAREEVLLRRLPTSYAQKVALVASRGREIRVLVMGNSEPFQGVKPAEFGCPALNLADTSQSIHYDTAIVLRYLDAFPRLRVVVFPISYFSLWYRITDSSEPWRAYLYALYYRIPGEGPEERRLDLRNYSFLLNFSDVRSTAGWFFPARALSAVPVDGDGSFAGADDAATAGRAPTDAECLARVRQHEGFTREANLARNVADLEAALAVLRARGVAAVLTTLPVRRCYASRMRADHYAEMVGTLTRLAAEFHVEYRDYLQDPRFSDQDFGDPNHLDTRGALRFSRILRDEVLSRYLACARGAGR